ncbi:MAG: hypothetical protein AABY10_04305 [Nanoarchaeota archaeon]
MNNKIRLLYMLGIISILALIVFQSVSAYSYDDRYLTVRSSDHVGYVYNNYDGRARIYINLGDTNDRYYDRNRDLKFLVENRDLLRQVVFLDRSANSRFYIARGKSSGEIFYQTNDPYYDNPSFSDYRNREAYDPLTKVYKDNNYYKPVFDPQKGYYNWRY